MPHNLYEAQHGSQQASQGSQQQQGSQCQTQGSQQQQGSQQKQFQQNTAENFGPNNIQNQVNNISKTKPQQLPNPGISEREIHEILTSSGMINGVVTDGIKLAAAISDIIVKNNQLLVEAIQSGNLNQKPFDDVNSGQHQVAAPTQMWEAGLRPSSGMPAPDTKTNNPYSQQSGQSSSGSGQSQQQTH
jgi:hypothetical protein